MNFYNFILFTSQLSLFKTNRKFVNGTLRNVLEIIIHYKFKRFFIKHNYLKIMQIKQISNLLTD